MWVTTTVFAVFAISEFLFQGYGSYKTISKVHLIILHFLLLRENFIFLGSSATFQIDQQILII